MTMIDRITLLLRSEEFASKTHGLRAKTLKLEP